MIGARDTVSFLVGLMGSVAFILAVTLAWLGRPADAAGVVVGAGLLLANFVGLHLCLSRLVAAAGPGVSPSRVRRGLWMGATGLRLVGLALVVAVLAGRGWIGIPGLLAVLVTYPCAVVAAGLRAVRTTRTA